MYRVAFVRFARILASMFLFLACSKMAAGQSVEAEPLAPGYGDLEYELPRIGSYNLPPIKAVPDGNVLDEGGNEVSLHQFYRGKYTLLSFIYSNCKDVNGCPLASHVFYKIKKKMQDDAMLADNLRLASLSFDPERDTPEVMRLYAANYKYSGVKGEWHFLTTPSLSALAPILNDYGQDIQREKSINGEGAGDISHILRVFLIDPELNIRNIYSVGFLHADLILNDIKTLLLESGGMLKTASGASSQSSADFRKPVLSRPGDVKDGYETDSYVTASKSVANRRGEFANLLEIARNPPLGLPPVPVPDSNPLTQEKIALGRKLFYDRRLSLNDTISCAMCHVPEQGFSSNEMSMAVGIEGRSVRRNSPTIYNIAYATRLFHDGRETTLEHQIWAPLLARNEMANPSIGYVIDKLKGIREYREMFYEVFGDESITMRTVSQALAAYERVLISADSPFDRWYYKNEENALNASEIRGFELFTGKAGCASCHTVTPEYAIFTDNAMHNTGTGYNESMGIRPETERVILAPGITVDVDTALIDSVGEKTPADTGYYEVTQNPDDRWKYRTPGLRNISLTAPYMHNGSLRSLKAVVEFYNEGGVKNELQDPRIKPLDLQSEEVDDLVSFMEALTGSNVDTLVSDGFAAPIGDVLAGAE